MKKSGSIKDKGSVKKVAFITHLVSSPVRQNSNKKLKVYFKNEDVSDMVLNPSIKQVSEYMDHMSANLSKKFHSFASGGNLNTGNSNVNLQKSELFKKRKFELEKNGQSPNIMEKPRYFEGYNSNHLSEQNFNDMSPQYQPNVQQPQPQLQEYYQGEKEFQPENHSEEYDYDNDGRYIDNEIIYDTDDDYDNDDFNKYNNNHYKYQTNLHDRQSPNSKLLYNLQAQSNNESNYSRSTPTENNKMGYTSPNSNQLYNRSPPNQKNFYNNNSKDHSGEYFSQDNNSDYNQSSSVQQFQHEISPKYSLDFLPIDSTNRIDSSPIDFQPQYNKANTLIMQQELHQQQSDSSVQPSVLNIPEKDLLIRQKIGSSDFISRSGSIADYQSTSPEYYEQQHQQQQTSSIYNTNNNSFKATPSRDNKSTQKNKSSKVSSNITSKNPSKRPSQKYIDPSPEYYTNNPKRKPTSKITSNEGTKRTSNLILNKTYNSNTGSIVLENSTTNINDNSNPSSYNKNHLIGDQLYNNNNPEEYPQDMQNSEPNFQKKRFYDNADNPNNKLLANYFGSGYQNPGRSNHRNNNQVSQQQSRHNRYYDNESAVNDNNTKKIYQKINTQAYNNKHQPISKNFNIVFPKRIPAYTQPIPFFNNQNIHDKEEQVCEDSSNGDRQLYNGLRKNPSNGNYVVNEANEEVHYGNLLMNESSQKNRVNINRDGYDSLRRSSKNFVIQNRSNFMQEKTPPSGPAFKRSNIFLYKKQCSPRNKQRTS